jgi:RNA polymerase sigma factor (sigma-70 family)
MQPDLSKEEQQEIAEKKELTNKDYEKIFIAYQPRIFNFICSRVSKKEDAEDITSIVFERVLKKLRDFQWQGITITSWIYRIARNAIIDYYRKNSERQKDASVESIGDFIVSNDEKIEQLIINDEEELVLYNAIRTFSEEDQYLVYYKFFEDLSNKEIAEIMNLTETNVGTRLHRLRNKIKSILDKANRVKTKT